MWESRVPRTGKLSIHGRHTLEVITGRGMHGEGKEEGEEGRGGGSERAEDMGG